MGHGMMQNNQQQPHGNGGKNTEVVHVYADSANDASADTTHHHRRLLEETHSAMQDVIGIKKCVLIEEAEICGTYYVRNGMLALDYTQKKDLILREDEEMDVLESVEFIE